MIAKRYILVILILLTTASLASCKTAEVLFGDIEEPPLEGKRISVLQYQDMLEPDPILASSQMMLPDSWQNSFWPQTGGYPSHSMGHLYLDTPLKKKWSKSIGSNGGKNSSLSIEPIVADETIFTIDAKATLSAFDTKTGKRKWKKSLIPDGEEPLGSISGGIAFSEALLFVTVGYKQILCLDPNNGKIIWQIDTISPTRSAPAVLSGKLFVTTLDNTLLVYDTQNGKKLWSYTGVSSVTNLLGSSSPAIDGEVIVATMSSGEVIALRTENGQVLWQDSLASTKKIGALPGISDIKGLPVIDRGIVYIIASSGRMVAIDKRTGQRIWQKEIGGSETPWAAGDTIFVLTSNQQLVALNRADGKIRWVSQLPDFYDKKHKDPIVWTGPLLASNNLVIASNKGHLLLINPVDGTINEKYKFPHGTTISPIIADNWLYIVNSRANLISYSGIEN